MEEVARITFWIALSVAGVAMVSAVCWYIHFYAREHFRCPHCGHCWKPPLVKLIFSINCVTGKVLTCPRCGKKEYMEPQKDHPH